MTDIPKYTTQRVFDASPVDVWNTWVEAESLAHWYGPGVETIIHKLDVKVGGEWHNEMRMRGMSMMSKAVYTHVDAPNRLTFTQGATDNDWNITPSPMMPDWPKEMHTDVTLEAVGDKTKLTLMWSPHNANEAELACFASMMEKMGKGWSAGFDLISELLKGR